MINRALVEEIRNLNEALLIDSTNKGLINEWLIKYPDDILKINSPTPDMIVSAARGDSRMLKYIDETLIDNEVLKGLKNTNYMTFYLNI